MEGLTVHMVNNIAQVAMLLKQGIASRITSATTMNAHSSRSHAIFTVYLQVIYNDPLGHQHIRNSVVTNSPNYSNIGIVKTDFS